MSDIEMTKDAFLAIAAAQYDKLQGLGKQPDFFSYEAEFDAIWTEFGRQALEASISKPTTNHRKKTSSEPGSDASA